MAHPGGDYPLPLSEFLDYEAFYRKTTESSEDNTKLKVEQLFNMLLSSSASRVNITRP